MSYLDRPNEPVGLAPMARSLDNLDYCLFLFTQGRMLTGYHEHVLHCEPFFPDL